MSVNVNGSGKYFADDANTLSVPAFSVLNATVGLNKPIKILSELSLSGFFTVNNIFDRKYAASSFINPDIVYNEAIFLEPGLPRNFILSFSISY